MTEYNKIPEAQYSSAGDDFHVRWVIKRSIDLLNFDPKGLKSIVVEDVEKQFSEKKDPSGQKFLGVDLSEYFGGSTFLEADKVIVSQVKYSTTRSHEKYSVAKLYESKKRGTDEGSIIHRFGELFKPFITEFGENEVVNKLRIKLISNRAFNATQLKIIKEIQSKIIKSKYKKSFSGVVSSTKARISLIEKLKRLENATGLNAKEFRVFFSLLDFEECGVGSRNSQRIDAVSALCKIGSTKARLSFNSLFQLVWSKMMPEAEAQGETEIYKGDVLMTLELEKMEDLFPVLNKFEELKSFVDREVLSDLIREIESNDEGQPICLHGGAGIGKSTMVKQLSNKLPEKYKCVLFDCYGSGDYLNPSDQRHQHKIALFHLSNELARVTGSSLLINRGEKADYYIREFKSRLNEAVEILKEQNKDAEIILIIDAADNSITAAENDQSTSFIQDLLKEQLPLGIQLVVSCRTHRKDSLGLPLEYVDVEILPFTLNETEQFLLLNNIEITDRNELEEFRKRTKGIPRVQKYAIESRLNLSAALKILKPKDVNTVESILEVNIQQIEKKLRTKFSSLIEGVSNKVGKDHVVTNLLKYLISLPRPVPIDVVSSCSGLDEQIIRDIAVDFWGGLILANDEFSFNDEDFENYIREKIVVDSEVEGEISEFFMKNADSSEYCSVNLGNGLIKSGDYEKLKEIVLNNDFREEPKDVVRNKEIYISRVKLAMKASKESNDDVTFFKLAFIAAEQVKEDIALKDLFINNPELAYTYSDSYTLRKILSGSINHGWYGGINFTLAAITSRDQSKHEQAKNYLNVGNDWAIWKSKQNIDRHERRYDISEKEIAFGAEAHYRLFGLSSVINWLSTWSPKTILPRVIQHLTFELFGSISFEQAYKELSKTNLRLDIKTILLNQGFKFYSKSVFDLEELVIYLNAFPWGKLNFTLNFSKSVVELAENLIAFDKKHIDELIPILNEIRLKPFVKVPHFPGAKFIRAGDDDIQMDIILRRDALIKLHQGIKLKLEDYYPKEFIEPKAKKGRSSGTHIRDEKDRFDRFFKHALPIYSYRASCLLRLYKNKEERLEELHQFSSKLSGDYEFSHYDSYQAPNKLNFFASILLKLDFKFDRNETLDTVLRSFTEQNRNYISLRMQLLNVIVFKKEFYAQTCIRLLDEIEKHLESLTLPSNELVEHYIDCCKIASKIELELGNHFFKKAITALSEIDVGAYDQIESVFNLSKIGLTNQNISLAKKFTKFLEYSSVKLEGYDKFPFREGLIAISNFSFPVAFAALTAFHHKYRLEFPNYIISLLNNVLEKDFLNPRIASSLLPLGNEYWKIYNEFNKNLVTKFNENSDSRGKNIYLKQLISDIKREELISEGKEILSNISDGRFLSRELVNDLQNWVDFTNRIEEGKTRDEYKSFRDEKETTNSSILFEQVDGNSSSSIENVLREINKNNERGFSLGHEEEFFKFLKNECRIDDYVSNLNALIEIDPELVGFHSLRNALKSRLDSWGYSQKVKNWKKDNFKKVFNVWSKKMSMNGDFYSFQVEELSEAFSLTAIELSDASIAILAENIDRISSTSIYQLLELVQSRLTKKDNETILGWLCNYLNTLIEDKFEESLRFTDETGDKSSDEIIAMTLRHILGDPRKENRWRALHGLRRLTEQGEIKTFNYLYHNQDQISCIPFQGQDFPFFWISAKLYFWIGIAKIIQENPKLLEGYGTHFYNELLSDELPHVLIKYYVKISCLNLYASDNSIYNSEQLSQIKSMVVGFAKSVGKGRNSPLMKNKIKYNKEDWRFDFDTLDTIPYPYSNLGRLFNKSGGGVANIADVYISEKWGYVGNPNNDDHVRAKWEETSNHKGDIPPVENLRGYYEYHGMYCAASELLKQIPLVENEEDFGWGTWDHWLESDANTWKNEWLADLADPRPLDSKFWIKEYTNFDEKWKKEIPEILYDEMVGFAKNNSSNALLIHGGFSRHYGKSYESVSVNSALVSLKSSKALLRALQSEDDPYSYGLPINGSNVELIIDNGNFKLLPWLKIEDTEYSGLDGDDPFAKGASKSYIVFDEIVTNQFDIKHSNNFKISKLDSHIVGVNKSWDNTTEHYSSQLQSNGGTFQVKGEFILNLLNKVRMGLIVKCRISRYPENQKYDRDNFDNNVKFFLIKPNGEVETLRGASYKIGSENLK